MLAKRAGVELRRENPAVRTERERLYLAMEHATLFFQRNLGSNEKASGYLKKRGLSDVTIHDWRVGYAPLDWTSAFLYLQKKGVSAYDIERVGLAKKSEKKIGEMYDRFRGRIMFPIFDSSGRVVAFSGRQLESDGTDAKYLNSPETPLFEKSKILYGYDRAKLNIRRQDFALLVEGQMDLLMSHQSGFTNTVASSGTALTVNQLEVLKRLSNKLVIAYDGDGAGERAASRGWQIALGLGMEVKIATLPEGKDPADMCLENAEAFAKEVSGSRHIIDVELDRIVKSNSDDRGRKVAIEKELMPYVAGLRSIAEQSHFIPEIAYKANMKEEILWQIAKKLSSSMQVGVAEKDTSLNGRKSYNRKDGLSRMLMGLVYWQKSGKAGRAEGLDIRQKVCTILGEEAVIKFESYFAPLEHDLIFEAEASYAESKNMERHVDELIFMLKEELLREERDEAMRKLQTAERDKNPQKTQELIKLCQELSNEIGAISKKLLSNTYEEK